MACGKIQQMRGNCSPNITSNTRVPPICVFISTMPGCSATTSPMMAASRPSSCCRICRKHGLRHLRCNDSQQLSLIGNVERIQPQHFACALYRLAHGNRLLSQYHSHSGTLGDFVQGGCCATARRIAQTVDEIHTRLRRGSSACPPPGRCNEAQSLAIAPSNSRFSRCDMIAIPWSPM